MLRFSWDIVVLSLPVFILFVQIVHGSELNESAHAQTHIQPCCSVCVWSHDKHQATTRGQNLPKGFPHFKNSGAATGCCHRVLLLECGWNMKLGVSAGVGCEMSMEGSLWSCFLGQVLVFFLESCSFVFPALILHSRRVATVYLLNQWSWIRF